MNIRTFKSNRQLKCKIPEGRKNVGIHSGQLTMQATIEKTQGYSRKLK